MSVKPVPNPDESATSSAQTPMMSPKRDVQRLQQNSAAVAGELKEFLAQMHGRSAKERLGIVATSGLFRSLIGATAIFAILIAVLTVVPYFGGKLFASDDAAAEAQSDPLAEAQPAAAENENEDPDATTPADPDVKTGQPGEVDLSDPGRIQDNLGIGDVKEAPANVNPLDGSNDDLLDGLD